MNQSQIVVSTDGSALGNPNGSMGWAWADHHNGKSDAGGATNGTNQIGELCAVLQALRTHPGAAPLTIQTDSQYAINCSTKWVQGWKKKGWKNAAGKPVKNRELIEAIDHEIQQREGKVTFFWVKGHAGDEFNEKVDDLARSYAEHVRSGSKRSYLPLEGWRSLLASPYTKGLKISEEVRLQLHGQAPINEAANQTQIIPPIVSDIPDETQVLEPIDEESPNETLPIEETQVLPTTTELPTKQPAPGDQGEATSTDKEETAITDSHSDADNNRSDMDQTDTTNQQDPQDQVTRGLQASGDLVITPPPSRSPYFAGKELHISGSISFEADIDQEGRVHISSAPFRLHAVNVRQDDKPTTDTFES